MSFNIYQEDENIGTLNKMLDQIKQYYFYGKSLDSAFKEFKDIVLSIPDIEVLVLEKGLDLIRLSSIYDVIIMSNLSISKKQIIDTMLYNYNFDFGKFSPQLPDNFFLKKDKEYHPEAFNEISINFKEPSKQEDSFKVSTFNFYFVVYSEDNIELRINNLQGWLNSSRPRIEYRKIPKEWKTKVHRIYSKLNSGLKENWQIYITQEICKIYGKNYKVFGDIPPAFSLFSNETDVYFKYLLNYLEYFLSGGVDVKNIGIGLVMTEFKKFIKTILETISKFPPEDQIRFVRLLKKKYMVYIEKLNLEKKRFHKLKEQEDFIRGELISVLNFKNHT